MKAKHLPVYVLITETVLGQRNWTNITFTMLGYVNIGKVLCFISAPNFCDINVHDWHDYILPWASTGRYLSRSMPTMMNSCCVHALSIGLGDRLEIGHNGDGAFKRNIIGSIIGYQKLNFGEYTTDHIVI